MPDELFRGPDSVIVKRAGRGGQLIEFTIQRYGDVPPRLSITKAVNGDKLVSDFDVATLREILDYLDPPITDEYTVD